MARNSGHRGKKNNSRPTVARWLWIFTILIIGGLIAFLLMISRAPSPKEKTPNYPVTSTPPAGTAKPKKKFDFYEILPNKQVNAPVQQSEEAPAASVTPPTQPPATKAEAQKSVAKQYWVQVGSFDKFDDADQLKAELTLQGFLVMIQSTNSQGNLRFKVRSGPYADKTAAVTAQKEFETNGFSGQVVYE